MWKEFKEFALRGNVIELAVAVVLGIAFGRATRCSACTMEVQPVTG